MALDRSSQPIVKDASGVLVGVAQVRVGKPSIRDAAAAAVQGTKFLPVGRSRKIKATSNQTVYTVKPNIVYADNKLAAASIPSVTVASGTYTGNIDGCIIIRACIIANKGLKEDPAVVGTPATCLDVFDTYGSLVYSTTAMDLAAPATAVQGITFGACSFAGAEVGDTWVLPVWTKAALNVPQTGIISPYSMFSDATDSIGGLKSASFQPKIDSVKKLQSGFPSYTADQIVDSVSVDVSWSGYEYTNAKLALLKQMISRVINTGELSAISVEMVMRTRGGSLVRMWIPSCTFTSLPTYAPTNDYSDVSFAMSALKQTEFSTVTAGMGIGALGTSGAPADQAALDIYNAWLSDSMIYNELPY